MMEENRSSTSECPLQQEDLSSDGFGLNKLETGD